MRKEKLLGPMEQFLFCAFRDHPGCRNGPQLWQFLWFSSFCASFSLSKNLFLIRWMSIPRVEAWEPMSHYLLFRISNAFECHQKLFSQLLPKGNVIVDFANKTTTQNSVPVFVLVGSFSAYIDSKKLVIQLNVGLSDRPGSLWQVTLWQETAITCDPIWCLTLCFSTFVTAKLTMLWGW